MNTELFKSKINWKLYNQLVYILTEMEDEDFVCNVNIKNVNDKYNIVFSYNSNRNPNIKYEVDYDNDKIENMILEYVLTFHRPEPVVLTVNQYEKRLDKIKEKVLLLKDVKVECYYNVFVIHDKKYIESETH